MTIDPPSTVVAWSNPNVPVSVWPSTLRVRPPETLRVPSPSVSDVPGIDWAAPVLLNLTVAVPVKTTPGMPRTVTVPVASRA